MGLDKYIDLPSGDHECLAFAHARTKHPASLMAAFLSSVASVDALAQAWHWSLAERDQARFIVNWSPFNTLLDAKRLCLLSPKTNVNFLAEALRVYGHEADADALELWSAPVFPVSGDDLIKSGVKPGPNMGKMLQDMREQWVNQVLGE